MKLRPYQQEASDAFIDALRHGCNPIVNIATGGGKSVVIADIAGKLAAKGGRIAVVAHRKELLDQNSQEYAKLTGRNDWGIVSSGLNKDDWDRPVVFAGIQSVHKRAEQFKDCDLVIVDEADLVPFNEEGVMYTSFFKQVPARRGGMTATPWRLGGGSIVGPDRPFDVLAYQKGPIELVQEGWLAPLIGVDTKWRLNTKGITKTKGDYSQASVQKKMQENGAWLSESVAHALGLLKNRKHIVVFAPTVIIAKEIQRICENNRQSAATVHADSPDRDELLLAWKSGDIRIMCSVDILTRGFNFPEIDAIACFRPTESSALWVQALGRGMRRAAEKTNCLVLDYVGNLERLGGVATMEDWHKEKPDGSTVSAKDESQKVEAKQKVMALALSNIDPMLDSRQGLMVEVTHLDYIVRPSKTPGVGLLMCVYDTVTEDGLAISANQAVCVEHQNGARFHAVNWFKRRGFTGIVPTLASAAKLLAYAMPKPKGLRLRRNNNYVNVVGETF